MKTSKKLERMRILAIDPGTSLMGYGIVDKNKNDYTAVAFGSLKTQSNIENKDRVKEVFDFFTKLIKEFEPDVLALEKLFFFKNAKTVMAVSEMRGALLLIGAINSLPIKEYTPLQVKQAISGYGRAGKDQVERMVVMILGLKSAPKPDDVSDALALAICCANTVEY